MTQSLDFSLDPSYLDQLPTLGKVMCDVLEFFCVDRLYGVGGDYAANLISALEQAINICPAGNEVHAGFSACAQAEIEGIGACLSTYMVGSLPCTWRI